MRKSSAEFVQEARDLIRAAEDAGRDLTPSERGEVEGLLDLAAERKGAEDLRAQVETLQRDLDGPVNMPTSREFGGGPGDAFVKSKGYRSIANSQMRGQTWTSGAVEVSLETKGTVFTTPGTAITPAGYTSGIVQTLFQRPWLSELIPNAQAPGNPVRFVSETTATNAAAATSEGGLKPESSLVFGETSEPIRKVATFLPISDELLDDAPQIQSYLNSRLQLFVKQTEEQQLLLGTGVAPQLQGLLVGRSIGTFTRNAGTSNELAIFKAANGARGSSFLDPDTVIVHPSNWQPMRAGTDTSGQYYGGGPFDYGPYGAGAATSSSQFSAAPLWGMRTIVTSAIPVGTALVGAFGQGAQIWRRGGVTVEASNSHSTYFQTDLVALRAESRLALGVYRPSAFVAVIGLST
jgi:HK97 family phage major capsid protein